MPYYLYKISTVEGMELVKNLELMDEFDAFRAAKLRAKELRKEAAGSAEEPLYKVMFGDTQLAAEEQLLEKRNKPVLMEYEK